MLRSELKLLESCVSEVKKRRRRMSLVRFFYNEIVKIGNDIVENETRLLFSFIFKRVSNAVSK